MIRVAEMTFGALLVPFALLFVVVLMVLEFVFDRPFKSLVTTPRPLYTIPGCEYRYVPLARRCVHKHDCTNSVHDIR